MWLRVFHLATGVAFPLGRFQTLLREDMRETRSSLQRSCLLPTWAISRGLFNITFGFAHLIYKVGVKMGRLSAD